ncbi:MAG: four helix bundle protein [Kiritimatiellae bacterium]|nr:four helix bundle protein [Kiritimatiellia bacterium]
MAGHRHAKDQLLRASQAIALNIAEGNGKGGYAVHEGISFSFSFS